MTALKEKLTGKNRLREFANKICDRMYEPRLHHTQQCSGWYQLEYLVENEIEPNEWNMKPFHPKLRDFLIEHWEKIKTLKSTSIEI